MDWFLALTTDQQIMVVAAVVAAFGTPLAALIWFSGLFRKKPSPVTPTPTNHSEQGNNTGNGQQIGQITGETINITNAPESIHGELRDADRQIGRLENQLEISEQEKHDLKAVVASLRKAENNPNITVESVAHDIETGNTAQAEAALGRVLADNERKGQEHNAEAARAALHIGILAYYHDTTKALKHFTKATELAPNNADAWNRLGHVLKRSGQLDRAADAYRRAEALGNQIDDKSTLANAYGNLGNVELTRGNLDRAIAYYEQALAIHIELARKEGVAGDYCNLGIVEQERGNLDQAVAYFKQALTIDTELDRKEGMASDYGNLGVIEAKRGNLDAAVAYFEKALAIETELGRKEGMASHYGNLGIVEKTRDNLDQAVAYYQKSLAINTELGRKEGVAIQYANLGNVEQIRGNLGEARRLWTLALELFTEVGMKPQIEQVSGLLAALDASAGD